ncbi:MAG: Cupin 2 conserved barrel domain protein [Candidatus Saccharibacteria bacterium]|nr:Cupin 2 conserved barrel domain protein [Candidatus Saccharibacteria bacterium]
MELKKYRWSRTYESSEEELTAALSDHDDDDSEGERWTQESGYIFDLHTHDTNRQIYCVEGSITFTADNKVFYLQAGDTLDIPAHLPHSAVVGFSGCVCYEVTLSNS